MRVINSVKIGNSGIISELGKKDKFYLLIYALQNVTSSS